MFLFCLCVNSNLNQFYKEAKKRFDDEPDFKIRSQLMVPKLQSGDPRAIAGWKSLYVLYVLYRFLSFDYIRFVGLLIV